MKRWLECCSNVKLCCNQFVLHCPNHFSSHEEVHVIYISGQNICQFISNFDQCELYKVGHHERCSKPLPFKSGKYAFCMVLHVRWMFLTTSLRIPPESVGIRRRVTVVRNPSHMENHTKCIFSHTYTLRHFNQAKYTVQSCKSWKPCEMDLFHNCSLHGGRSEVCEKSYLANVSNHAKGQCVHWKDMWLSNKDITCLVIYINLGHNRPGYQIQL